MEVLEQGDGSPASQIRRTRLESQLDRGAGRRLTMLIGGPGTGKTTLLRQWAKRDSVWHTITPADRALSTIARKILERLRLRVPGLSTELATAVEGGRGPELGSEQDRADTLAAALCYELESSLNTDLTLIIDDFHHLGERGESVRFVASMCRNSPSRLHIVIASRDELPFATSRLSLHGEADRIDGEQLAFTMAEVEDLVELESAPRETARDILEKTGGWSLAVALAVRLAAQAGAPPVSAQATGLFDYLAEEVIGAEPPEVLEVLKHAAELPWVTVEMLAALGMDHNGSSVLEPAKRAFYTTPAAAESGAVTVSPLLAEFITTHFPLQPEYRAGLLHRAAAWYRARGAFDEAIRCLVETDDDEAVRSLIREDGQTMISRGHAREIVEVVEAFQADDRDENVTLLEAEARQMLGDWERAAELYASLVPERGPIPARIAWRLGFLEHMRGDVSGALEVYRRGVVDGGAPRDEASLLAWTASAHWLRGERSEARELADRALELARDADDPASLATAHTVLAMVAALDGDRAANDIHYLRALEHAERARDLIQMIRIRSNRGSHFLEEGDYESAMAELDKALRLADITGFEFWRAVALSNRAQVLIGRGGLEEAVVDLVQARRIFRGIGSALESYPLAQLGDVYALRGDDTLARASYEEAIRLAEDSVDLQALVPATAGLARVLADEEPEQARELADRAMRHSDAIGHVRALVAGGEVALAAGDTESARETAKKASALARSRRDLPGLGEALELESAACDDEQQTIELLRQALSVWSEVSSQIGVARVKVRLASMEGTAQGERVAREASQKLLSVGARGLAEEAARVADHLTQRAQSELAVKTFGGLAVLRNGRRVAASEWQSRIARKVLGMLAANRGAPLHREVLIERLWPDDALEKGSNRLSVALSTIRTVFDPDRTHGADHFLVADRDSVALDLDEIDLDIERLYEESKRGKALLASGSTEEGLAALRFAAALYTGELLGEFPYAEWATAPREEARMEVISMAFILARSESEKGNRDAAARWYLRILEQDAYNEPAHLQLIKEMVASGRHGAARRLYGIYVSRMDELGVEPVAFSAALERLPD